MAIRARVDRHKCIGAGNCITLAPTAFDWLAGDYGKSDVVGQDSVDEEILRARSAGAKFAVDSDAHSLRHLGYLRYGIGLAQRGWLTPDDVINAWPLRRLRRFLRKERSD